MHLLGHNLGLFGQFSSSSGTLGFQFRVRVASGFRNLEKFGLGQFRAFENLKSSGSGSFGYWKMPRVRVNPTHHQILREYSTHFQIGVSIFTSIFIHRVLTWLVSLHYTMPHGIPEKGQPKTFLALILILIKVEQLMIDLYILVSKQLVVVHYISF